MPRPLPRGEIDAGEWLTIPTNQERDYQSWGLGAYAGYDGEDNLRLMRVCGQHQTIYNLAGPCGRLTGAVSGRFAHEAQGPQSYPAVGDAVLVDNIGDGPAVIHRVLPRKSAFIRRAAGTAMAAQIVAANIDTAFICMSLNRDFNLRRLERYAAAVWDSGAVPVVVLTKSDLCDGVDELQAQAHASAPGTDVIAVTALTDAAAALLPWLDKGKTVAFIGSSGVGKSTLINLLLGGEVLKTNGLRSDDRGRHTTTERQMIFLPQGAVVIDTPGMRELALASADLDSGFADIAALAQNCRFGDCTHAGEPGCAVLAAIATGSLDGDRLASYHKLQKELGYEGLNARQRENRKIQNMFGGKAAYKRAIKDAKSAKGAWNHDTE